MLTGKTIQFSNPHPDENAVLREYRKLLDIFICRESPDKHFMASVLACSPNHYYKIRRGVSALTGRHIPQLIEGLQLERVPAVYACEIDKDASLYFSPYYRTAVQLGTMCINQFVAAANDGQHEDLYRTLTSMRKSTAVHEGTKMRTKSRQPNQAQLF